MSPFSDTVSGKDLWNWRSRAIAQAQTVHIDPAEVDWLLRGLYQIDAIALRLGTLAHQEQIPARITLVDLQALWEQRVRDRVPIQHLVGRTEWRSFTLRVSPAVLIPRPETELIVDIAAQLAANSPQAVGLQRGIWVDLGTGSGAISLGLAEVFPEATVLAVDVSPAALAIARQNAQENGLGDRIQFLLGSWFEPLTPWRGQLAGIVSNPPYIPRAIVPTLQPEVAQHEPHLALDGGLDGLDAVRHLIDQGHGHLVAGGIWVVELMMDQAATVMHLLAQTHRYDSIDSFADLAGIERFVAANRTAA